MEEATGRKMKEYRNMPEAWDRSGIKVSDSDVSKETRLSEKAYRDKSNRARPIRDKFR